ncbi:methyltransferase domain-containing protein [Pseudomonadota bacterium]
MLAILWRVTNLADQGTEGLLSPFLRKKRINAIKPYLKGRVLDVGCGSGRLASYIDSNNYLGVDIDTNSINIARKLFPGHTFQQELPSSNLIFDTVIALAVIEHVKEPCNFLKKLAELIDDNGEIICTTPHPSVDWIHDIGSAIGLFSSHANEEHEELLNKKKLKNASECAGLTMTHYGRFLLHANQIAVFRAPRIIQ